jgi:Lon protease-like protein
MNEVAVFPLGNTFLPGDVVMLNVFESRYLEMLSHVMSCGNVFASVLIARGSEVGGTEERLPHGVLIQIQNVSAEEHVLRLEGRATEVVSIETWLPDDPFPRGILGVRIEETMSQFARERSASALSLLAQRIRTLLDLLSSIGAGLVLEPTDAAALASIAAGRWWSEHTNEDDLLAIFWVIARLVPSGPLDRYELLRPMSMTARFQQLGYIIEHISEMAQFHASD